VGIIIQSAGLPGEDEDPGEGVNIFAQAYGAHMAFGAVFREPITTEGMGCTI
jgi:hypothetical protein